MKFRKASGFTLIEILVATFILVIVLTTLYAAFRGVFGINATFGYSDTVYSMARSTMDRMGKDLAAVCTYGGSYKFSLQQGQIGDQQLPTLSFISSAHLTFASDGNSSGITSITYLIERNDDTGEFTLLRQDALLQGQVETAADGFILCEKVQSLVFKFYDSSGNEYDSWNSDSQIEGQKNKPPASVLIDLRVVNPKGKENPYRFVTKVAIGVS